MERFLGRLAVVTGASSGIGAAISTDLVKAGMIVVGMDKQLQGAQNLSEDLSKTGASGKLHPLLVDVSVMTEVQEAFQWVDKNLGGVSVLVNNAGIMIPKRISEMTNESMALIVNTNILGVATCAREAINSMKKHNITDGHIININSTLGHMVPVFTDDFWVTAYAGTKHAVTAISKGLRAEVKDLKGFSIRVTSISPGPVVTNIISPEYRAMRSEEEISRLLKPADVSRAVCFAVASPPKVEIVELTIQATGELV